MTTAGAKRVRYSEGQCLRATDLQAEQDYLASLDRRHNIYQHGPGIVRGLTPAGNPPKGNLVGPGIAIDGVGREMLAANKAPLSAISSSEKIDLWIVYCSLPERIKQRGRSDCSPDAFQRWNEFGKVIVVAVAAAGTPVPPVAAAVYLGRVPANTIDLTYTSLRGQRVDDPRGRTHVQVGPVSSFGGDAFFIAATDDAGALTRRFAIDRLGSSAFWGTLDLSDYRARLAIPTMRGRSALVVRSKLPGVAGEHLRATLRAPLSSTGAQVLELALLDGSAIPIVEHFEIPRTRGTLKTTLVDLNRKSNLAEVSFIQVEDDKADTHLIFKTVVDAPLRPSGGQLVLAKWILPTKRHPWRVRGCPLEGPVSDVQGIPPTGIAFTAGTPLPTPVPLPGARSVRLKTGNKTSEHMRLDLGLKKDNDPSVRLAVGATSKTTGFVQGLTIAGTGTLAVIQHSSAAPTPVSITVTGKIEQLPLKPDATDPAFLNLILLAWLNGLQSAIAATTMVEVKLLNLPTSLSVGSTWSYTIEVSNVGTVPVSIEKILETRTIDSSVLLTAIDSQNATIAPHASADFLIQHNADGMPAGSLVIEARVSGKIGNVAWWRSSDPSAPIPVVGNYESENP